MRTPTSAEWGSAPIRPKSGNVFYLRTLLLHIAGATSYKDLYTVNGITLRDGDGALDYRKAYFARGFYENDAE